MPFPVHHPSLQVTVTDLILLELIIQEHNSIKDQVLLSLWTFRVLLFCKPFIFILEQKHCCCIPERE